MILQCIQSQSQAFFFSFQDCILASFFTSFYQISLFSGSTLIPLWRPCFSEVLHHFSILSIPRVSLLCSISFPRHYLPNCGLCSILDIKDLHILVQWSYKSRLNQYFPSIQFPGSISLSLLNFLLCKSNNPQWPRKMEKSYEMVFFKRRRLNIFKPIHSLPDLPLILTCLYIFIYPFPWGRGSP